MSMKKQKVTFKLSLFSRRFFHHLTTRTDCSIGNFSNATLGDLGENFSQFVKGGGDYPFDLCASEDERQSLQRLINAKQLPGSSVTLLSGNSGRGKEILISLGIASAIEHDTVDIYVLAADEESLAICQSNIERNLRLMGYDINVVKCHRNDNKLSVLEIVRGDVPSRIKLGLFNQPFNAYNVGLVCVLEIGLLSRDGINKILSCNPTMVWATLDTSGPFSAGDAIVNEVVRPLRSFCGVGETLPNLIEETSTTGGVTVREISNRSDQKKYVSITLNNPVLYHELDPLESAINDIFCLNRKPNVKLDPASANNYLPSPTTCEFMYINKQVLFSAHTAAEMFLARFMDVYTSFDNKRNSAFLHELVDDPSHHLLCLQQPSNIGKAVPQIITVLHVAIETTKHSANVRIINLITSKKFQRLGYGRASLDALHRYFTRSTPHSNVANHVMMSNPFVYNTHQLVSLDTLPLLLVNINDMPPLPLAIDCLSVRFVAATDLLGFWKKCSYLVTGIETGPSNTQAYCTLSRDCSTDQRHLDIVRYRQVCDTIADKYSTTMRDVHVSLAYEMLVHKNKCDMKEFAECDFNDIVTRFNSVQLRELDSFVQNMQSIESVQESVYHVAVLYFSRRLPSVFLPQYQELTLVGFGLQLKSAEQLATEIILNEKYQHITIIDQFNLCKDVQKMVPLLLSHVRECVRLFLDHVTLIMEQQDEEGSEPVPEKKRRMM